MGGTLKNWETLKSELVLKTRWFEIWKDRCRTPEGVDVPEYHTWKKKDCVIVFPVTMDEQVILIRQYRHGVGKICVDFPGGTIEKGQSVSETASEELLEETGYRANNMKPVGSYLMDSSYSNQQTHFVVATGCRQETVPSNPQEITEVFTLPLNDLQDFSTKNIDCLLCSLLVFKGIKALSYETQKEKTMKKKKGVML